MKKVIILFGFLFLLGSTYGYCGSLSDGLLFYLSFDDCSGLDVSGNGFDGELHGDIQCVDGKYGKALYLPTSQEYISIDKSYSVNDFTLSFWVKLDGKAGDRDASYNMFLQGANQNSPGYTNEFNFAIRDNDNALEICWDESDHPGEPCHYAPSKDIFDGEFHHIVYVKQGTKVDLYVDGEYFYTFDEGGFNGTAYVEYTVLGQDQDCYKGCFERDQILKGTIDEVRLYDRALSESEIKDLYNYSSDMCSAEQLEEKYKEGFEAGKRYCIEHPDECQIGGDITPTTTDNCATFDMTTQMFHVPCFSTGESNYDLYFKLTNVHPDVTLKLMEVR